MATQPTNPQPSSKPHPSIQAPAGTMLLDVDSVKRSDGSDPYVALPILDSAVRGVVGGGLRIRQIPAEVAAEGLAWRPEADGAWRLATDEEVDAYLASLVDRAHG